MQKKRIARIRDPDIPKADNKIQRRAENYQLQRQETVLTSLDRQDIMGKVLLDDSKMKKRDLLSETGRL